ncbi:MAG: S-methyl-5-thioribose-1-phosphate isomerase [Anaerolineae bacterium UTCFX2]|jgi:methylthioribose-1-phosphate isomerase|nr:S-methyl-5-thioribose-1-phosphate isomerase [Anaerolineales bacterium]OQY89271.1 MAG: S-methyl-5-thioribose-1-phosphate isomerase [Anaerolineae bacterium UTCFX2]
MRTVEWDYTNHKLRLIDQHALPGEFSYLSFGDYREVARAIRNMVVRGAPAIGVTAAFGMALAARQSRARDTASFLQDMNRAAEELRNARPTAVNLSWAVERMLGVISRQPATPESLRAALLDAAQQLADEDVRTNQEMALFGASLIESGDTVIHHCNTGSLAAVEWGTALGVIRMAHQQGKAIHVLVDETRPRLQGSRLTAWELEQYGIDYAIITDNAAGYFLQSRQVHKVLFGADRVAANGDVVNKIGTYMLALAAHANHVPVYPVVPLSTIDLGTQNGEDIPIEQRSPDEVLDLMVNGMPVAPADARARNPAFDITPHRLVSAIVTEAGIIYPPFKRNIRRAIEHNLK